MEKETKEEKGKSDAKSKENGKSDSEADDAASGSAADVATVFSGKNSIAFVVGGSALVVIAIAICAIVVYRKRKAK